jgi:flavin-dependent dehydrogenase
LRSRIVIAADGATSTVARSLYVHNHDDRNTAIAIRGYVETDVDLEHMIDFSFISAIQPGYAWFFPTAMRRANIGVGVRADVYKNQDLALSDALESYLRSTNIKSFIGSNKIQHVKTWQLPFCNPNQQRVFNGVLLVGDAGGFVNPLTGAGIYTAMLTGKYAAQASIEALRTGDVSAQGLAGFEKAWKRDLAEEMQRARLISEMLGIFPGLIDTVLYLSQMIPGLTYSIIGKL